MKNLVLILCLIFAAGCTKEKVQEAINTQVCAGQAAVVTALSASLVKNLECSNAEAVTAFLSAKAADLKVCKVAADPAQIAVVAKLKAQMSLPHGGKLKALPPIVGELVCQPLVDMLSASAMKAIPADWGCTGGAGIPAAEAKLLAACHSAL